MKFVLYSRKVRTLHESEDIFSVFACSSPFYREGLEIGSGLRLGIGLDYL